MKKVDFFIVGQPKSGTTALATFLSEHPQICISKPKEVGYFCTDFWLVSDNFHGKKRYFPIRDLESYHSLFNCDKNSKDMVLGEATTSYLYSKEAAKNIFNYNKEAKIIIMLREPIDMIYSLHSQYLNEFTEDENDFAEAINKEAARRRGEHLPKDVVAPDYLFYMDRAKYSPQLKRYFDIFPKKNILIILSDDFRRDNEKQFKRVTKLLGVKSHNINFRGVHESKKPRLKTVNKLLNNPLIKTSLYKLLGPKSYSNLRESVTGLVFKKAKRRPIDEKLKQELANRLDKDLEKTSKLLGVDLAKRWGYKNKTKS